MKYIDRNHLKVDAWGNLTKPVNSFKLRIRFYYKYARYQRVGGDFNVNLCEMLLMKANRHPVMEWYLGKLSKFTNFNHKCPYSGFLYARADNVSIDELVYPDMIPAGRYRIDTTVFEDNDRVLFNTSVYFSISDHRIDVSLRSI